MTSIVWLLHTVGSCAWRSHDEISLRPLVKCSQLLPPCTQFIRCITRETTNVCSHLITWFTTWWKYLIFVFTSGIPNNEKSKIPTCNIIICYNVGSRSPGMDRAKSGHLLWLSPNQCPVYLPLPTYVDRDNTSVLIPSTDSRALNNISTIIQYHNQLLLDGSNSFIVTI